MLCVPLALLLLAFVAYPLLKLTIDSVSIGNGLGNYADALSSAAVRKALITTMISSVIVTVLSVGFGGLLAWYVCTVKNRAVQAGLWLAVLAPIWMGTVVKNYAVLLIIGQRGLLNDLLGLFGLGPLNLLYTPTAVIIGMTYMMIPYAFLSLYAVFVTIDKSFALAARSMGASSLYVARTIVLPLATPGLVAGSAVVFAISVGFYVTPVLLGGAQSAFMATVIEASIFDLFDYPRATASSVILLLAALLVVLVALRLAGGSRLLKAIA